MIGSGENGSLTFADMIGILSFIVGLQNLDMNATQSDVQSISQALAEKSELLLTEIHGHLEEQDAKLDKIMEVIGHDTDKKNL